MGLSRRGFLGGMVATMGSPRVLTDEVPNLTLGVLSDIHIIGAWADLFRADHFVKALKWFDSRKVDGVVIAGDLTQYGMVKELEAVGEAWFSVFPDNRRSDGAHVEPLFVYGDHDASGWTHHQKWARAYYPDEKGCEKDLIVRNDKAAQWRRIFHEEFQPIFHKNVKGYDFILAHYTNADHGNSTPGLVDFVRKMAPGFRRDRPFFYVQHRPIVGTYRSGLIGTSQDARDALSPYANAFALSAHTHYTLTDEQTCWQGDFTCVGTSSMRYVCALKGRENTHSEKPTQMKRIQDYSSKQGMLMRVYDDRVEIERRDFVSDDSLGSDWIVPVMKAGEHTHWSIEERAKKWIAPEFRPDAPVWVKEEKGGKVKVQFPTIKSSPGRLRAFDYEVAIETHGDDGVWRRGLVKRVFSGAFTRPESQEPPIAWCVFSGEELASAGKHRFVVTPTDAFGHSGKSIVSEQRQPVSR